MGVILTLGKKNQAQNKAIKKRMRINNKKITPTGIAIPLTLISIFGLISTESGSEKTIAAFLTIFGTFLIIAEHRKVLPEAFNRWLRRQEQKDLRTVDLAVLAAEHGLEFSQEHDEIEALLTQSLNVIELPPKGFQHVMFGEEDLGRIIIFEYHRTQPKLIPMVGTAAEFNFQTVPSILLIHKTVQHVHILKSAWGRNHDYKQLIKDYFPGWLFPTEFICFYKGADPDEIKRFLENNRPFSFVSNEPSVRLISFHEKTVSAFYERKLKADGSNLNNFRRLAQRMMEVVGNATNLKETGTGS